MQSNLIRGGLVALLFLINACASTQAKTLPPATATPRPKPLLLPAALVIPTAAELRPSPTVPVPAEPMACPRPNLDSGQHISLSGSYTETQTSAAGPMVCRIAPGSCGYPYLVGDLNPNIVYKREEQPPFDQEDILMHPAMILPLSRLSNLVLEEWGGEVRLRVTDAYDSLLEHDLAQLDESRKISLHFEGRAIDLTTLPVDRTRYGRLCALAHCAGFDWVMNEGDHCHAAVKADSLCARC